MLLILIHKTSSPKNTSISAIQIVIKYDGIDNNDGCGNDFDKMFAS